jgi:hypothetical protein
MISCLRRGAVFASLLALICTSLQCTGAPEGTEPGYQVVAGAMRDEARSFLWSRQAETGGWHSQTHRILEGGQALTPFVLSALMETEADVTANEKDIARAMEFMGRHLNKTGVAGIADPLVLEYPNYATAYSLRVMARRADPATTDRVEAMQRYLIEQQFDASRSIDASHPAFGGWGFGERKLPAGHVGHVDLSHTRRVLQALRRSGVADSLLYRQARVFLGRLQKREMPDPAPDVSAEFDGGFYYSPVVSLANKGGLSQGDLDAPVFKSYATATCDGILALLATGLSPADPRIREAVAWLDRHPALDFPPGIPTDDPAQWHRVMQLYHLAARAEVYHALGWPEGVKEAMVRALGAFRRSDGAFVNPFGGPNKEDDPLLATALALTALEAIVQPE